MCNLCKEHDDMLIQILTMLEDIQADVKQVKKDVLFVKGSTAGMIATEQERGAEVGLLREQVKKMRRTISDLFPAVPATPEKEPA